MNPQLTLYFIMAVVAGTLGGIHVPINGSMAHRIGSTLVATFTFYGIAFVLISLACLVTWDREAFTALKTVPRWYFIAGVISVVVVGTNTYLIPRLGAVNVFVVMLSSQMVVRMIISHFGWLESPVAAINPFKLLGGALLILGAVLVVRN